MKTEEKVAPSPNESETLSPAAFRLMIHELRVHQIELAMQNEELRRANATLQAVMDQSPAGIAIADAPSGKLRYVNDAGILIRGGTRETVINGIGIDQYVASWRLMDLDGRPLEPDEVPLARAILFGETCSREFIIRKDDGDDRIVIGNAAPIKDEEGRVVAGVVVFTDMTERKRTEAALEKSEMEFRLLAESMPQIVWITRADGGNIYFNQQWVDYTGLTLEESYGHGWSMPFHPDDRQRALESWQNATKNDAAYALECRLRRFDGIYQWWLIRGVPLRDPEGKILKWFGTCTDIEHIKQAEKAILASEERFRRAVVDSPFPILLHAEDGAILQVSNSWCEITGYTREELATIGDWTERAYGEKKAVMQVVIDALYHLDHRSYQGDYTIRTKSGAMRVWEFSSAPLGPLSDGRRLVISMAADVTERRQAEARVASHLEELRRWQNVMLDREDRVRELKREVNEFCRRVGESARYPSQDDAAAEHGEAQAKQEHTR